MFAKWQDREWDGSVNKELDKQIAEAVIDNNETIKTINDEIDSSRTVRGQFQTTEVEGQTVGGEEEEEES